MAYNLDLRYKIATMSVSSDLTTDSPSVEILILHKTKLYSVGTFKFAELSSLTGTSTAYSAVVALATSPPANTNEGYALVEDSTITNEDFVVWAQGYPNSSMAPFIDGLFP